MHARFRSPLTRRFLSVDPLGGDAESPQSWNRYTYSLGNPVNLTDPDGRLALRTFIRVIRQVRKHRIEVAKIGRTSAQRDVERTKRALRNVSSTDGAKVKRVVQTPHQEGAHGRERMAEALDDSGRARRAEGPTGPYPEHQNPESGEFKDVHVEIGPPGKGTSSGMLGILGAAVAPTLFTVAGFGDATPSELLSAAAWDVLSATDPIGVTDAIGWAAGID